jgi:HD-like signal output (HDOD) protein
MACRDTAQHITLEWLVGRTTTVYSLPVIYERLNEVINHPRSSLADIAEVVTEDQGLTARILRLANSPMFGFFAEIDSITRALTIIGTQQVRDISLAASVMGMFKGIPDELLSMTSFWRHSIACGIIARTLATYRRDTNVERFFVAGILHDVGQLAMCTAIPELVMELLEESRATDTLHFATESRHLGFNHAKAGGSLLDKWMLPHSITEPVACHHAPNTARKYPVEASVVHLADIICQSLEFGSSAEWHVPPLDPEAWKRLGIPVSALSGIIQKGENELAEVMAIMTDEV